MQKLTPKETPLVVLAEGCFGTVNSKMATGVIRYGDWPIAAVIDSTQAGKTVEQAAGIPCQAKVVASFKEALAFKPKALLVGIAIEGGELPPVWRHYIVDAIKSGLHVINGLHTFIHKDEEFARLAKEHNVVLWDVRDNDQAPIVALQKKRPKNTKVITLVGSDCAVGKMVSALELYKAVKDSGKNAHFVATGQTGILISGSGVPLDRVIGDFMAGHTEREIFTAIEQSNPEWIFVEGQGSLVHPGFSGVTMSLLHGSNPDALILVHNPRSKTIDGYEDVPIPSLKQLIEIYESACSWTHGGKKKARVVGIALNCHGLKESEARAIVQQVEKETGLPATDPVKFGVQPLVKALEQNLKSEALVGVG